jgi:hypothetical protein
VLHSSCHHLSSTHFSLIYCFAFKFFSAVPLEPIRPRSLIATRPMSSLGETDNDGSISLDIFGPACRSAIVDVESNSQSRSALMSSFNWSVTTNFSLPPPPPSSDGFKTEQQLQDAESPRTQSSVHSPSHTAAQQPVQAWNQTPPQTPQPHPAPT